MLGTLLCTSGLVPVIYSLNGVVGCCPGFVLFLFLFLFLFCLFVCLFFSFFGGGGDCVIR